MNGDGMYPTTYRYTKEHEWVSLDGDIATIGITDYAQHELGDAVYVEMPKPGVKVKAGEPLGTVESVKAVSDVYAPVSGEVIDANAELQSAPEKLNSDPHTDGWLIKVKVSDTKALAGLMDAAAYEAYISDKQKEASA
jgi:glycine cleavage system H protein